MERWLQTLAVAAWILSSLGPFIAIFFTIYLVLFTSYWWLILLYILWICTLDSETCETGGRRSEWVQNWIFWKYLGDYFPVNLKRVPFVEDPKKNYLLCVFPHPVQLTAHIVIGCTNPGGTNDLFPNFRRYNMSLGPLFQIPFFREFFFSLGMCNASAKSIEYVLSDKRGGNVCNLMPGGGREIFYWHPGRYTIYYNKRKGFVRCSLKTGSPLVPAFTFGEIDQFDRIDISEDSIILRFIKNTFAKKYRDHPFFIPVGRGAFGLLPKRGPVTMVVGKPLEVPKIENPTSEQIDEVHEEFKQCIIDLFEEHKHFYVKDAENTKLEII